MRPFYSDDWLTLYGGDCREVLASLPSDSVDCVVTSPPYWGLRDYGTDGQLGLERTPEEYVANMVGVFREVRRVLKPSGTCWLNLGDSYASRADGSRSDTYRRDRAVAMAPKVASIPTGLKNKDLVGIPWRVAFALQADGWVLRSDVVWSKPNPMPESVTDRPTKSHEMLFLLTKAKWVGPPRGRFADITDSDARWMAMFLDTEGSIVVKRVQRGERRWYGLQIVFSSTSAELVETARNIVGQGTVLRREGTNAPMFYYQLSNQAARDLLHRVYPFLIVKRAQASIGIAIQDRLATKGKKRPGGFRAVEDDAWLERAWETNKSLNHFGTPDLSWVPEVKYGKWDSQPYYFDADAVAEPSTGLPAGNGFDRSHRIHVGAGNPQPWMGRSSKKRGEFNGKTEAMPGRNAFRAITPTRNIRSVWTIATRPYPGAHFAVFPPELPERCIKAGSPEGGTVLDPFGGSGTVGMVANHLSRRAILIDLNPDYLRQQMKRNAQTPLGLGAA